MPLFFGNLYLLLFFGISIFTLFVSYFAIQFNSQKIDTVGLLIAYITMVLFYGVREPGTTDIKMYLENFDALNNFSDFNWGIGFYILMKSIKTISSEHAFFIFASSFIFATILLFFTCIVLKSKPYKSLFMISLPWFSNKYLSSGNSASVYYVFFVLYSKKKLFKLLTFFRNCYKHSLGSVNSCNHMCYISILV